MSLLRGDAVATGRESQRGTLITGASGLLGGAIVRRLLQEYPAHRVSTAVRGPSTSGDARIFEHVVYELDAHTPWSSALMDIDTVIHCAARVHVMRETATDALTEFRRVNVLGTLQLARCAAAAGVKRFIYISSIKVNGEGTSRTKPFTAADIASPQDAYGVSKHEAEDRLRELAADAGLEIVIIRPPLIYGPGVKANFAALMRWLKRGLPLPLGAVDNLRSLVGLDNVVDLIRVCMDHPAAANQTFLVSDGEDISTTELLSRLGRALGRPARLIPVPVKYLKASAKLFGKEDVVNRLCGSLRVDIEKTRELLGWHPLHSIDEGLISAAEGME